MLAFELLLPILSLAELHRHSIILLLRRPRLSVQARDEVLNTLIGGGDHLGLFWDLI